MPSRVSAGDPIRPSLNTAAWGAAIRTLGAPAFAEAMLDALRETLDVRMMSALWVDTSGRPHHVFGCADSTEERSFAIQVGHRYVADFWRLDPAFGKLTHGAASCTPVEVVQQAWDEIPESDYRSTCYEALELIDRVSIFGGDAGRKVMVSAYRHGAQGAFSSQDVWRFADLAPMLASLLDKHLQLCGLADQPRQTQPPDLGEHLTEHCPSLSSRERQVCIRIAQGLTAKEIAHELHLELSSVITYKNRAFAKLGMGSRRELLKICRPAIPN